MSGGCHGIFRRTPPHLLNYISGGRCGPPIVLYMHLLPRAACHADGRNLTHSNGCFFGATLGPQMHELTGRTHWHEPTGNDRAGFGEFGRPKTPYDLFMESEGIPIYRDIGVSKVQNLPLAPWKRLGGKGSYIQLHGTEVKWGSYVVEVPGAGALNAEKHLYEEIYRVVDGRGTTEVWLDHDSKRHVFEWQKGSLFSIPVNAWHRVVNASSAPALLLGGTTAPNLVNLINNVEMMFNCPYEFRDRFSGADDFYKYKDDIEPDPVRGLAMRRTNFIPD